MVNFPNIENQWHTITHRTVECEETFDKGYALKGRGICLAHTVATPIKIITSLAKLVLSTIEIATIIFSVITLNAPPRKLFQAGANVVDVAVGTVLLPIATLAHLVRGVAGIIIHPKCMIKETDFILPGTKSSTLCGAIVNY